MELKDFLMMLSGVGVIGGVSWCWEYFGWFPGIEPKKGKLILFGISLLVALVAYFAITFVPAVVLDQISPVFLIISALFVNLFSGEVFHKQTK